MRNTTQTQVPTAVPAEDDPVRCPYCNRPFRGTHLRNLHLGEAHSDRLSPSEDTDYEEAVDHESDELFVLHLKIVAGLVLAFFAIAYLYVFVLS